MTPSDFTTHLVSPTLQEYLHDRGNERRALMACILTYSLIDRLGNAIGNIGAVHSNLQASCRLDYDVVQGITNGTKHAGKAKGNFAYTPGQVQAVPMTVLDVSAILDASRLDLPGLTVDHNGQKHFVDKCVQTLLRAIVSGYMSQLGSVDLSFLDPP